MMEPEKPTLYPAFLDLRGKRILLVGGGEVAFRKAETLEKAGCRMTVVSREFDPAFRDWLAANHIPRHERPYRRGEAAEYEIVFSATDDPETNQAVAQDAAAAARPVNVADEPELCSFFVPAVVRRGPLQIAVSTGGQCPALARRIREDLEKLFPASYGPLLVQLGSIRNALKATVASGPGRRQILQRILDSKAVERALSGDFRLLLRMADGWTRARRRL
jgi:siroheme synthase-like protein